jgi:hypothetical protein
MNRGTIIVLVVLLLLVGGAVAVRQLGKSEAARRLALLPKVRSAFDGLRAELASSGIELVLVSTRRSQAEQDAKVKAGQSATNNSWHLLGRGLDVQTAKKNAQGKLVVDADAKDLASYKKLHEVAKRYGFRGIPQGSPFTSSGDKAYITNAQGKKIWDVYHLEFPEHYPSVAAARAADSSSGVA